MKKSALFFVFAVVALGANGQGIERVRESLARPDDFSRARVSVTEQPDAAAAIRIADQAPVRTKTMVYGVSLFRDNSQSAGGNAGAVEAQFAGMFPEIPVKREYKSPFFIVSAGNFVDRTDAVALCGKVLSSFPKAVVVQEEIEITH